MKKKLTAVALAAATSTALAQTGPDEPAESGAYSLQEPQAQDYKTRTEEKARGELYGFAMVDMGYNDGSIDEDWFDVVRPSKLPGNSEEEDCRTAAGEPSNACNNFTTPGSTYASVRQSRLGVKGWFPTMSPEARRPARPATRAEGWNGSARCPCTPATAWSGAHLPCSAPWRPARPLVCGSGPPWRTGWGSKKGPGLR